MPEMNGFEATTPHSRTRKNNRRTRAHRRADKPMPFKAIANDVWKLDGRLSSKPLNSSALTGCWRTSPRDFRDRGPLGKPRIVGQVGTVGDLPY